MKKSIETVTINGFEVSGTPEFIRSLILGQTKSVATDEPKASVSRKKSVSTTASKKQTKKESPVSTKVEKVSAKKATGKVSVGDFEPKKDKDGQYNWASYKSQRTKYVEAVSGKTLHGKDGQWLDGAEYKKLAKKFEDKFHYVKKSDR